MDASADEPFKELCANYGAAMYYAQVLEYGITNALVFLELIPKTKARYSPEQHDEFCDGQFAKTLGKLIRSLEAVAKLPPELRQALLESRDRRAHLAHHFFREASDRVVLGQYASLLDELEGHRAHFAKTDEQLLRFVAPVLHKYGFTEERQKSAMAEYNAELKSRS